MQKPDQQLADDSQQQYGPWLLAQSMNSAVFGIKQYGGRPETIHWQQQHSGTNDNSATKKGSEDSRDDFQEHSEAVSWDISSNLNYVIYDILADNDGLFKFQKEDRNVLLTHNNFLNGVARLSKKMATNAIQAKSHDDLILINNMKIELPNYTHNIDSMQEATTHVSDSPHIDGPTKTIEVSNKKSTWKSRGREAHRTKQAKSLLGVGASKRNRFCIYYGTRTIFTTG